MVCNIAGIGTFAWTHEMPIETWNRIIGVNLTGTFLMCKATIPHLLDGGGVIVNTASTAGLYGQPWSAAYCGSKGGVVLMTKALAYEYEETPLRVNAVAPGGVETPIQKDFYDVPGGRRRPEALQDDVPEGHVLPAGRRRHLRPRRRRTSRPT